MPVGWQAVALVDTVRDLDQQVALRGAESSLEGDDAAPEVHDGATDDRRIPAPGAMALLALAIVAVRRR